MMMMMMMMMTFFAWPAYSVRTSSCRTPRDSSAGTSCFVYIDMERPVPDLGRGSMAKLLLF